VNRETRSLYFILNFPDRFYGTTPRRYVNSWRIPRKANLITISITISIRLRYNYDTTTIRLRHIARLLPFDTIRREQKMNMRIFRRSRVVVASQSNRNCDIGKAVDVRRLRTPNLPKSTRVMTWL